MQLLPAALEQILVRRVPHQCVLEAVDGFRRIAAAEDERRLLKLGECTPQCTLAGADQRAHQGKGELASDGGANLRDLPHRGQPVEPRHQRVSKSLRDGERWQGSPEPITLSVLDQDACLKHRLGEFFDEQRVPVSLGDDLFHYFNGQNAPAGHLRNDAFHVLAIESTERQVATLGRPTQGGLYSGRKVNSARTGSWLTRSTVRSSSSREVASAHCKSSNESRIGCLRARPSN